jgi:hypothetical protein
VFYQQHTIHHESSQRSSCPSNPSTGSSNTPLVPPLSPIPPPIPNDPAGAFTWVLTHIIGLDTAAKVLRVTGRGGVLTVDDLLLVNITQLLDCLTNDTTIMSKTRLQHLKQWAEDQYDVNNEVHVHEFTAAICCEYQMKLARSKVHSKSK